MKLTDEQKQLLISYNETFNGPHGKRVLKDLMTITNFNFSNAPKTRMFNGDPQGQLDVNEIVRREGQRSVIIHIIRQIEKKL